ncbi:MAG: magnesium/cobalt transporter CorA [Sandaracinaceae bacterium]
MHILAVRGEGEAARSIGASRDELPALVADPDVTVWVCLSEQNHAAQRVLADVFGFHPLLIEDALADATTPKIEDHDDYLYLIVHGLSDADPEGDGEVHTSDLDLFIGERYLITHESHPFGPVRRVRDAVERTPALLARGPAVVAHRIIDGLVDEFLPMMENLDHEIDAIEEGIVEAASPELLSRIFRMKHSLQRIRRVGLHQRRLLERLAHHPHRLLPEEVRPFYRDVLDHFVRVVDLTEVYRELIGSSLDAYLSMQSHRLNEIMRILTVISTVMLPLTFITGLYGMNFDFMPGLHWKYGYETAVLVMIAIVVAMLIYFRRRRWL